MYLARGQPWQGLLVRQHRDMFRDISRRFPQMFTTAVLSFGDTPLDSARQASVMASRPLRTSKTFKKPVSLSACRNLRLVSRRYSTILLGDLHCCSFTGAWIWFPEHSSPEPRNIDTAVHTPVSHSHYAPSRQSSSLLTVLSLLNLGGKHDFDPCSGGSPTKFGISWDPRGHCSFTHPSAGLCWGTVLLLFLGSNGRLDLHHKSECWAADFKFILYLLCRDFGITIHF